MITFINNIKNNDTVFCQINLQLKKNCYVIYYKINTIIFFLIKFLFHELALQRELEKERCSLFYYTFLI